MIRAEAQSDQRINRRVFLASIPTLGGLVYLLHRTTSSDSILQHDNTKTPSFTPVATTSVESTPILPENKIEALGNIPFKLNNWNISIRIRDLKEFLRINPDTIDVEISLHHYLGNETNKVQIISDTEKDDVFDLTPRIKVAKTESLSGLVEELRTDDGWSFLLKSFPLGITQMEIIQHSKKVGKITSTQNIPTESVFAYPHDVPRADELEIHSETEIDPKILEEIYNLGNSLNGLGISIKRILLPKNKDLTFIVTNDNTQQLLTTLPDNFSTSDSAPVNQKGLVILTALGMDILTDPEKNFGSYLDIKDNLENLMQVNKEILDRTKNTEHLSIPDAKDFGIPHLKYPAGEMYMARVLMRQVIPLLKYQPYRVMSSLDSLTSEGRSQSIEMIKATLAVIASATNEAGFQKFFPDPKTQELFQLIGFNK